MSPLPAWYNCKKKKKKIEKRFVKCQRVQVEEIKGDFLLKTGYYTPFYTFDTFPVEQLRIIIFNHETKMIRLQPVQVNNNSVQKD